MTWLQSLSFQVPNNCISWLWFYLRDMFYWLTCVLLSINRTPQNICRVDIYRFFFSRSICKVVGKFVNNSCSASIIVLTQSDYATLNLGAYCAICCPSNQYWITSGQLEGAIYVNHTRALIPTVYWRHEYVACDCLRAILCLP